MTIDQIKEDVISFADDVADVVLDKRGNILYTRNGKDEILELELDRETGAFYVLIDGDKVPYRKHLARGMARLDLFASKILEKRSIVDGYVDGCAELVTTGENIVEDTLEVLKKECSIFLTTGTKLTFITADAGHGKTALLKQFQHDQAKNYLLGKTNYLFWHVDLQGRELVRLNEALMYDLGELRIPGLFYSEIITLIKRRYIVLAIDGFDELAAEIGGSVALGALSGLVSQMDNSGTIVAASRRTFFDSQDYVKRTKLLEKSLDNECVFNEIKLKEWTKKEVVEYASLLFDNPEKVYSDLLVELGENENHPILTRPFLATKVLQGIEETQMSASQFVGGVSNSIEGVETVVAAFIQREVNKWKQTDKDTGKPYLTFDEHLQLLELIANEMWSSKRDTISLEEVQLFTTILVDDWNIDTTIRPMIMNMVRSHAFLILPSDQFPNLRKFEHEEFKNFFLAGYLKRSIIAISNDTSLNDLKKFLHVAQLPDTVAQYSLSKLNSNSLLSPIELLQVLATLVSDEWKPTHLQTNVGTMAPFIMEKYEGAESITFDAKVNYTSLVFENRKISNIEFKNGNFINISLRNTGFINSHFSNCSFNELRIHVDSENEFLATNINITCEIGSISEYYDGVIINSIYSPTLVDKYLIEKGLRAGKVNEVVSSKSIDSHTRKSLMKFLNYFNRGTTIFEKSIQEDSQYSSYRESIFETVVPLLEKNNIISEVHKTKNKQANSKAWRLKVQLPELLYADSNDADDVPKNLSTFWTDINKF